tara:strand:+ start:389 stop:691 length:303 start_codon:yes stop_codon:yes gene_type:complete
MTKTTNEGKRVFKTSFEPKKEVATKPIGNNFTNNENVELDSFYESFNTSNNRKNQTSRVTLHKYINTELGVDYINRVYSSKVGNFLLSLKEGDDFLQRRK